MSATSLEDALERQRRLIEDADRKEALERAFYRAGMLVGVDVLRAEQDYHRRRLTRQLHWLEGAGTVFGLAVEVATEAEPGDDAETDVILKVSAGLAIDGLGRELLVPESHCISLTDWLQIRPEGSLDDAFDAGQNRLFLRVTARYGDCLAGLKPVLAQAVNSSTDAVARTVIRDGFQLELLEDEDQGDDDFAPPAAVFEDEDGPEAWKAPLSTRERAFVDAFEGVDDTTAGLLRLRTDLLHAPLPESLESHAADDLLEAEAAETARILLARVGINTSALPVEGLQAGDVSINNLVRPFVQTTPQVLALLQRLTA